MKKILLLKHWQLFLLFYFIPAILQILLLGEIMDSEKPKNLIALASEAGTLVYLFWIYSMAVYLFRIKQEKLNIKKFKISFFFLTVYFIFFIALISFVKIGDLFESAWAIGFVILHLAGIYCYLYCAYFNAKLLNSTGQNKVRMNEILGDIFLILFFPLGVWFIQPRLNKIVRSQDSATSLQKEV